MKRYRRWPTISTNNKSSNIIASCTCNRTPSRESECPFSLLLSGCSRAATREFKGARTKDASAINDGSPAKTRFEPCARPSSRKTASYLRRDDRVNELRSHIRLPLPRLNCRRPRVSCVGYSQWYQRSVVRGQTHRVSSNGIKTFENCLCDKVTCDLRDPLGVKGTDIVEGGVQVEVVPVSDSHLTTTATMGKHMATVQRKKAYSKPSSVVGQYVWRWKMWVHSTFVLGMLEPWETFLVGTCLLPTVLCDRDSLDVVTPQSRSSSW